MKRKFFFIFLITLVFVVQAKVQAAPVEVTLRNGNTITSFYDLQFKGGLDPAILRTYNSKANFKGIFGWGWGSEYETYLTIGADSSLVLHEFGGGADNRFASVKSLGTDARAAVEQIAKAAQSSGHAGTPTQVAAYKGRLMNDPLFRDDEWMRYQRLGKVRPAAVPVGTQFKSVKFSYQYITKIQEGYVRKFDTGKVEVFDDWGRLIRIEDKNRNFIKFSYGKDGHLKEMEDNFHKKMEFTFNDKGLVSEVRADGVAAVYQYNNRNELIYSKDVSNHVYTYGYDPEGHHNLTDIGYTDKTHYKIGYYGSNKHENVKFLKERNGAVSEYDYGEVPGGGKDSLRVKVKIIEGGKVVATSQYDYYFKHRSDGEEWTARLVTAVDGEVTDTYYNEKCGLPDKIVKGREFTTFEYDNKCHVISKETPTELTHLDYDPAAGKVSEVRVYSKVKRPARNRSGRQ